MNRCIQGLFAALCGASVMLAGLITTAPAYAQGPFEGNSLFVNISSGRVDRALVALRIAAINLMSDADVAIFFADQAAPFSVRPECLNKRYDKEKLDLEAVVGLQEVGEDPNTPSIKGLMAQGMVAYGCPICVAHAIDPKQMVLVGEGENATYEECGELFNPDGTFDEDTWDRAVLPGIIAVLPPNAVEAFSWLYDQVDENGDVTSRAAVISF